MHVLGISQRRKSSKSKDLHIRKVSFSGCSLSSACSFSSSGSTVRGRSFSRTASEAGLDPPPRLYNRPLLDPDRKLSHDAGSMPFFHGRDEDYDIFGHKDDTLYELTGQESGHSQKHFELELPPHVSPMDHSLYESSETQHYCSPLAKRNTLLRSRWSESTIQTLDQMTPEGMSSTDDGMVDDDGMADDVHLQSVPNFSYKRCTVLKRPPLKSLDSLEDFIKRGGWKRRGIVFHDDDVLERGHFEAIGGI